MSEAINSRKAQQTYLRETQQEAARRKRELAQQKHQDTQSLKTYYADENTKIDEVNSAAVNYIKDENKAQREAQHAERVEAKTTYDRTGRTSAPPKVQSQNYKSKETDDFYKVQDRGSRVTENSNGYTIEAYAPDHEKDQIRVSIQNDKAIVSGKRKFQDSVDQGNKKISTNSFQTFREEFSFDRPVTTGGMTRERTGDYIRFYIPKMESSDRGNNDSEV